MDDPGVDFSGAMASGTGVGPDAVFGRERRLHARAYDHWVSLLRGRRMPLLADLDPGHLDDFAGHSVLIELVGAERQPTIAFLGRALRDEAGIAPARPDVSEVPAETLLSELLRRFGEIASHGAPIGFEAELARHDGAPMLHRGILLPFADDDGALSAVYGVISWKMLAVVDGLSDITAAVTSAFSSRRLVPATSVWGDGPGAAARPAPRTGQTLPQRLTGARTWAALAQADRTRSTASLHAALGIAHDLLLEARNDPAAFAALARSAEVRTAATARNVIALIFGGPAFALSRIQYRRYAFALDHAARLGLGPAQFGPWLDHQAGGVVAATAAERRARRQDARLRQRGDTWDWMVSRPALGHVALSPIENDMLLLLGRRAARGVDVIASVPSAAPLTDAAIARVRAA
ncbi:hypothetical protein [uncultured Sphingomonas sp.]|uniref:hypothetical protein n=1 Tax=uncultured Sphingomonas sp. TaxID=158754 RepID=UPI0025F6D3A1|nr:hypothetical protein [uncultured Sphingomonas sp.]